MTALTIGSDNSLERRLARHYEGVKARLHMRPKPQNHIRRILAEAEERKRIEAERAAQLEKQIADDLWLAEKLTDKETGERIRFAYPADEARRVEIALASRDPERRMGGYKPHPHDTHDFTDAISHILETHAVTWDAVCSSSRFPDACTARVMVSRLYFSFGLKPFEVSRRTGIDASTLRYHWRAMNTETERQEEPVFSHAITCVKHK